jgi:hypothetical protein
VRYYYEEIDFELIGSAQNLIYLCAGRRGTVKLKIKT